MRQQLREKFGVDLTTVEGVSIQTALRMAAQSLHRSKAGLGDWFRGIKSKLGTKAAVTAPAHKLARSLLLGLLTA